MQWVFQTLGTKTLLSLILCLSLHTIVADDNTADKVLNIGGANIEVYFEEGVAEGEYKLNRQQVIEWIETSANAVTEYFHKFPVKNLKMLITDGATRRVDGMAFHGELPFVRINIKPSFDENILANDWVMVHELVHLSFPPVFRRHNWLLEGLATYVEPIVRVRAGMLNEDEAWKWLIKGTPQGLPEAGNKGLDNTFTWGQKYWGGAIFFLVADKRIHQQTNNKYGIEHALRAIQKSGGSMQTENIWQVNEALKIGDKATGTKVLMTLYNEMKDKPVATDLNAIWRDFGVSIISNQVVYDNDAPQASLRDSIYKK